MLTNLRSRLALFLLPGIFLVPIAISSLGDLTHVATCERAVRTPFTLNVPKEGPADVLSSLRLTRSGAKGLCGGLTVNLAARTSQAGAVEMIVPVTNHSAYLWRGTVTLRLGDTPVPVNVGSIPTHETKTASVRFDVRPGSHQLNGSLLIGP